jgi:heme-degrading monooxygenase HmoA
MAVMFTMEFSKVGQKEYDGVMKDLGLDKKGAKWPKGIISHTAGKTAEGWCVVDVWESEQDFAKFRESKLNAILKKHGMPEPRATMAQVHFAYPGK